MNYAHALVPDATEYFVSHWNGQTTSTSNENMESNGYQPRYGFGENDIGKRFRELAQQWQEETEDLSSLTEILSHEAYLSIIGLGRPVLHLLFAELKDNPNFWFTAISSILRASNENVDVVHPSAYGDLQKMTDAWLEWGEEQGYLD